MAETLRTNELETDKIFISASQSLKTCGFHVSLDIYYDVPYDLKRGRVDHIYVKSGSLLAFVIYPDGKVDIKVDNIEEPQVLLTVGQLAQSLRY